MPEIQDAPIPPLSYGPARESPAPAQRWLELHRRRFGHFIGGRWTRGSQHFETLNPFTGEVLARVAQATPAQVERAVRAAEVAWPQWQALGDPGRKKHLKALAQALQQHAKRLALLETLDTGLPIRETQEVQLPRTLRMLERHAGGAHLRCGIVAGQEPPGVVAQIVASRFPLLALVAQLAPALAAGLAVVVKPAPSCSLTALCFAQLCQEAGLPPGVFNLLTGDERVAQALAAQAGVARIEFCGSADEGRALRRLVAGSGKPLSLQLERPTTFLIAAEADIDAAVEGVVESAWILPCAEVRLRVHEGTSDRFMARLEARVARLRSGDPLDRNTDMAWRVDIRDAAGAIGMLAAPGPRVELQTFRTPAEAIELTHRTRDIDDVSVWTESLGSALEISRRLKAARVGVNLASPFEARFGEVGQSEPVGLHGAIQAVGTVKGARLGTRAPARSLTAAPRAKAPALKLAEPSPDPSARLYIGGRWAPPASACSREVRIGTHLLGRVPEGQAQDLNGAVQAARAATGWEGLGAPHRARTLRCLAQQFEARRSAMWAALSPWVGPAAARRELQESLDGLLAWADCATQVHGASTPGPSSSLVLTLPEPIGVVGLIASDDGPLLGLLRLAVPALALGNRVVVVPSVRQSLAAEALMTLLDAAALPAGTLNLVSGPADALADALAAHPEVDALWWPGATAAQAGRVEALSASSLKRLWVAPPSRGDTADPRELVAQSLRLKQVWLSGGV